ISPDELTRPQSRLAWRADGRQSELIGARPKLAPLPLAQVRATTSVSGGPAMHEKITISHLQQMKRQGQKSVGVVAWDYQIARIADRAGFDFISVGDSVGVNLWGRADVLDVTVEEMLICCQAVRRGAKRALVSCDMPYGPVQHGSDAALAAAQRLMRDGGAEVIKVDAAAEFPDVVRALVEAGVPVFAQFGLTPQTASKYGIPYSAQNS